LDSRFEALEIKIAYVEKSVADLDEVVRLLADQMQELARDLRELREERSSGVDRQSVEVPPHY
jgi:uncharacterized coiled-coil protein SlyX